MAIFSIPYFWKFLPSASRTSFEDYLGALEITLLEWSKTHAYSSKLILHEQLLQDLADFEANLVKNGLSGKSRNHSRRSPWLATKFEVGHGKGREVWHLRLFFTEFPHVIGLLAPSVTASQPQTPDKSFCDFLRSKLVVDVVYDGEKRMMRGKQSWLYVYEKAIRIRSLSSKLGRVWPSSVSSPLLRFQLEIDPILNDTNAELRSDNQKPTKSFLDDCDQKLLEALGEQKLTDLLKSLGLKPSIWFRAQSSSWRSFASIFVRNTSNRFSKR